MSKRAKLTGDDAPIVFSALDRFIQGRPEEGRVVAREIAIELVKPNQSSSRGLREDRESAADRDADRELEKSVRSLGVLQPILVKNTGKFYQIIAGERRFRAAVQAGLDRIPCVVLQVETEEEEQEVFFAENIHRAQLNGVEEIARQPLGELGGGKVNEEALDHGPAAEPVEGYDTGQTESSRLELDRFPFDEGSNDREESVADHTGDDDTAPAAAQEGNQVGDEPTERTGLEDAVEQAAVRAGELAESLGGYSPAASSAAGELMRPVVEAELALERLRFLLLEQVCLAEAKRVESRFSEELAALRQEQQELREAARREAPPPRRQDEEPVMPAREPSGVPLREVEARRTALLKEIKNLVEYRQQLRQQLESLLGQVAASGIAERPVRPSPKPTVEVEEITSTRSDSGQRPAEPAAEE